MSNYQKFKEELQNGKEFSGETTVTPKDHLNSYLPIMEDINKGKFNG